jgi:hypothetical protein
MASNLDKQYFFYVVQTRFNPNSVVQGVLSLERNVNLLKICNSENNTIILIFGGVNKLAVQYVYDLVNFASDEKFLCGGIFPYDERTLNANIIQIYRNHNTVSTGDIGMIEYSKLYDLKFSIYFFTRFLKYAFEVDGLDVTRLHSYSHCFAIITNYNTIEPGAIAYSIKNYFPLLNIFAGYKDDITSKFIFLISFEDYPELVEHNIAMLIKFVHKYNNEFLFSKVYPLDQKYEWRMLQDIALSHNIKEFKTLQLNKLPRYVGINIKKSLQQNHIEYEEIIYN